MFFVVGNSFFVPCPPQVAVLRQHGDARHRVPPARNAHAGQRGAGGADGEGPRHADVSAKSNDRK